MIIGSLLMCRGALRRLRSPSPARVEAGGRSTELRASATQARRRTPAGRAGRRVGAGTRWGIGRGAQVFAVVGLAFRTIAEHGVCFGDFDEALGGLWIVGVAVWMVGFGERVERPLFFASLSAPGLLF
jgi:hypothetical protein